MGVFINVTSATHHTHAKKLQSKSFSLPLMLSLLVTVLATLPIKISVPGRVFLFPFNHK